MPHTSALPIALRSPISHLPRFPITSHHQNRPRPPPSARPHPKSQNHRNPPPLPLTYATIFNRSETHSPSCIKSTTRTPYQTPQNLYPPHSTDSTEHLPRFSKKHKRRAMHRKADLFDLFHLNPTPLNHPTLEMKVLHLHFHPDPTYQNPPNRWEPFSSHPVPIHTHVHTRTQRDT